VKSIPEMEALMNQG